MADRPSLATVVLQFILDNSVLLVIGAGAALVWANVDHAAYERATSALHFAVNDIGMVFFFALATKEVYEATLPGGPLSSGRKAAVPVLAAIGGMAVPATIFAGAITLLGPPALMRGWAIPCATDIAFSYLAARLIFRRGHPAIPFLLLLAIADDALGLILLALFYPSGTVAPLALALWGVPAVLLAWTLRKGGVTSFWAYVLGPGTMMWIGLYTGGIHPALALVPIVPFMPHHASELKTFGNRPLVGANTLHEFEQWWKIPVQIILLAFGLVNAGVPLTSVGTVTWVVVVSLVLGKPIGIVGSTLVAERFGLERAEGLDARALTAMGVAAGIGFTVALFFTTAAYAPGAVLEQAKMGALLSFAAFPIAILIGRALGIRRA